MQGEQAYLFRHALLRDPAYQLHLPSERARLHGLAAHLLHEVARGLDPSLAQTLAEEIAEHCAHALQAGPNRELHTLRLESLKLAATHEERAFRLQAAARLWSALADQAEGNLRVEALRGTARLLDELQRFDEALALLDQALTMSEGDEHARTLAQRADILRSWAKIASYRKEPERAKRLLEEACETYRHAITKLQAAGDHQAIGGMPHNLASALGSLGDKEQSGELYQQALRHHRRHGLRRNEGNTLANLGFDAFEEGRWPEAETLMRQGLEIHKEVGNTRSLGTTAANLGLLLRKLGRSEEAWQLTIEAVAAHRQSGRRFELAWSLSNLALFHFDRREWTEVGTRAQEAVRLFAEMGVPDGEIYSLGMLAVVALARGAPDEANALWNRARVLGAQPGCAESWARCLAESAVGCARLGLDDKACGFWSECERACATESEYLKVLRRTMHKACERSGLKPLDAPA